jgi:HJR/Mrr/RecB family endonuclease
MSLLGTLFSDDQESRVSGEPEWMPTPDEVARARVSLEHRGVVQSLGIGPAGAALVPPGQIPWLWWGLALFWIVVWPALIATKVGGLAPGWMPLWLILVLATLNMLVLAGPVVYSERVASRGELRRRFGRVRTLAEMLALEPVEFENWVAMLFQLIGYKVKNTQEVADHGIDLLVTDGHVRYGLVQCKRYRGTVGEPVVRDLYGTLTHENADFGWLVTTGGISRQARTWALAGGKPLELWDGQKLVELARRYR